MERATYVVALITLLGACADPGSTADGVGQSTLGACQQGGDFFDAPTVLELVDTVASVDAVDLATGTKRARTANEDRILNVSDLPSFRMTNGSRPSSLVIAEAWVADLEVLPADARVIVGMSNMESAAKDGDTELMRFAGVVTVSGQVGFVGNCMETVLGQPIRGFSTELHPDMPMEDLLVGLMTDDTLLAEFREWNQPQPTIPWVEQDPTARAMDPDAMPPEFVYGMQPHTLSISIPKEWTAIARATICVRVTEAWWVPCIPFLPMGDEGVTSRQISGWLSPGGTIEIWLFEVDAPLEAPTAKLGEITPRSEGSSVTISGPMDAKTFDDLVAAASTGEITVSTGTVP